MLSSATQLAILDAMAAGETIPSVTAEDAGTITSAVRGAITGSGPHTPATVPQAPTVQDGVIALNATIAVLHAVEEVQVDVLLARLAISGTKVDQLVPVTPGIMTLEVQLARLATTVALHAHPLR